MNEGSGISTFLLAQKSSKKRHRRSVRATKFWTALAHTASTSWVVERYLLAGTLRNALTASGGRGLPISQSFHGKWENSPSAQTAPIFLLLFEAPLRLYRCPLMRGQISVTPSVCTSHCFGGTLYSTPPAASPLSPSPRGTVRPLLPYTQNHPCRHWLAGGGGVCLGSIRP